MEEYAKILIPVDGSILSELAFSKGLDLAKIFRSEITVLHVMETVPIIVSGVEGKGAIEEYNHLMKKKRTHIEKIFQKYRGKAKEESVIIKTLFLKGNPAFEIVKASSEFDLIIMGAHLKKGLSNLFRGNIAEKVANHSSCSILLVRDEKINPQSSE